ncbi:HAD-IIIC family phosphatase [Nonomuraea sp. NPDC050451]|uniref:HAD-IIIC family phosphatase n=1 Tax=Nonomuraea sp. NPDC050451 TaxID=3364364 RepID=UPI0037BDB558
MTVKCLIWDLDETLWKGTLLETEHVTVSDEIRRVISELDARGILNSVASKNDHEHAWARLRALGLDRYFVVPEIGWGTKSAAVRRIAERLGFAHHTVAFVDDQPAERAEVAYHLPDVRCFPAEQASALPDLPEFQPVVTEESRHRREMYQASFHRTAEREGFTGPDEDFLRSLAMVLRVTRAAEPDLDRVEELTLRTSQMNATGVHYPKTVLRSLLADTAHDVLIASLTDRFGSHGSIALMLLERGLAAWRLKLLAASCRVVSFGVGSVLLSWLGTQAARAGAHLIADFRRTERNRMMAITYRFMGFRPDSCTCHVPPTEGNLLHLIPAEGTPPSTMRLIAPDLLAHRTACPGRTSI